VAKTVVFREPVYTFQIDFNRHVSNIVYIQWMEIGRLKLLEAIGLPVERTAAAGFLPILVETQITYKRPLFVGDTVEVELWVSELSGVYAWMEFSFRKVGGDVIAHGRQKGVFLTVKTNRPKRLSEEERAAFLPFLQEEDRTGERCHTMK
jgi:acyl-CoA thioester hydrolase